MMKHPIFSSCGKYRYTLERELKGSGPKVLFIGINPSIANAENDDPTVEAWTVFSNKLNASKFYVANIFNYIDPIVSNLKAEGIDPIGSEGYTYLQSLINQADLIIPCWGDRKKLTSQYWPYFDEMKELLIKTGKPLKCYGYTKITKDPVHVQRLPRDRELIDFQ